MGGLEQREHALLAPEPAGVEDVVAAPHARARPEGRVEPETGGRAAARPVSRPGSHAAITASATP